MMKEKIEKMSREILSLSDTIRLIEEEVRADDATVLQARVSQYMEVKHVDAYQHVMQSESACYSTFQPLDILYNYIYFFSRISSVQWKSEWLGSNPSLL